MRIIVDPAMDVDTLKYHCSAGQRTTVHGFRREPDELFDVVCFRPQRQADPVSGVTVGT